MKKLVGIGAVAAIIVIFCLFFEHLNIYIMIKTGREIPVVSDIMHNDVLRIATAAVIILCFAFIIIRKLKDPDRKGPKD